MPKNNNLEKKIEEEIKMYRGKINKIKNEYKKEVNTLENSEDLVNVMKIVENIKDKEQEKIKIFNMSEEDRYWYNLKKQWEEELKEKETQGENKI